MGQHEHCCSKCGEELDGDQYVCDHCDNDMCFQCGHECPECGSMVCDSCATECMVCGRGMCPSCVYLTAGVYHCESCSDSCVVEQAAFKEREAKMAKRWAEAAASAR